MERANSLEKTLMLGKIEGKWRKGQQRIKHHQINGHKFEQTPRDSEGQGSLVCCSLWGHKELDTTEQLNNNNKGYMLSREAGHCSRVCVSWGLTLLLLPVGLSVWGRRGNESIYGE